MRDFEKARVSAKKKTIHAAEQDRPDVKELRENWKKAQPSMDVSRLIFLDESGVNTGMTTLYGRAKGKQRVVDYTPDVRYERTSVLSSMRLDGTIVPLVFTGALNGELFLAYVKKMLKPTLRPGDIIIMDNLTSHKVEGVIEAIEETKAEVVFLPPYSPDLNPIELMWSKMKTFLRSAKARTRDLLDDAIANAIDTININDIKGWFCHDGYSV